MTLAWAKRPLLLPTQSVTALTALCPAVKRWAHTSPSGVATSTLVSPCRNCPWHWTKIRRWSLTSKRRITRRRGGYTWTDLPPTHPLPRPGDRPPPRVLRPGPETLPILSEGEPIKELVG